MYTAHLVIVSCWAIFIAYWAVSAFFVKRTIEKQSIREQMKMSAMMIIVALLLLRSDTLPVLGVFLWSQTAAIQLLAEVSAVLGLVILIWSRIVLGRNWSGIVVLKEDHELVTSGPYAYVRHPIYTGISLLFLGTVLLYGSVGSVCAFLLFFYAFYSRSFLEEALMMRQFPNAYPAYKAHTKAIIPFLW